MARDLTAGVIAAINEDFILPIFLTKIDTSGGLLRLWTGLGNLTFNSEIYLGIGKGGKLSDFQETSDLRANGITLSLSGVSQDMLSIALSQIQQGRDAIVFMGYFDNSTRTLIVDPYEIFTGVTDIPIIKEGSSRATIAIKCENRLITLNIPKVRRYTKEDQSIEFPNDLGFDFVPSIQDKVVQFGSAINTAAQANLIAQT